MRNASIKLAAKSIGVEKIDASASGGYLVFGANASVDPLRLVDLVQKQGKIYKLQGSQRLQFRVDLDDINRRYEFVDGLLMNLGAAQESVSAPAA